VGFFNQSNRDVIAFLVYMFAKSIAFIFHQMQFTLCTLYRTHVLFFNNLFTPKRDCSFLTFSCPPRYQILNMLSIFNHIYQFLVLWMVWPYNLPLFSRDVDIHLYSFDFLTCSLCLVQLVENWNAINVC